MTVTMERVEQLVRDIKSRASRTRNRKILCFCKGKIALLRDLDFISQYNYDQLKGFIAERDLELLNLGIEN